MHNKIIAVLQQFGPLLPVEIASKTNMDSFMAKAYLVELAEEGKIKISKEKIAESNLYFLSGQEPLVQQKLMQIAQQQQKTPRTYSRTDVNVTPEVAAKRDAFAQRLAEIEAAEQKRKQSNPRPLPPLPPIPKPVSSQPTSPEPRAGELGAGELEAKYEPEIERTFIDKAMDWLRLENIEIIEELTAKKTEIELIVKVNTDFGQTLFYVKIKQKKTVTEADLVSVYAAAMEQNLPGVLLTNGKLSKSADRFLTEKEGVVKVKVL